MIEYLETPPTRLLLRQLIVCMGRTVGDVPREKATPTMSLGSVTRRSLRMSFSTP